MLQFFVGQNLTTDTFIASLAKKYGMPYTKGKKGEERFYSDDGRPIYPPNNGAIGKEGKTVLPKGTVVSRYGSHRGKYTSPDGTSLGERSLDKKQDMIMSSIALN